MESLRAQSEERVGELIIEKTEIKDKLATIEKQFFSLKREAADADAQNKSMRVELEANEGVIKRRSEELGEIKTQMAGLQESYQSVKAQMEALQSQSQ